MFSKASAVLVAAPAFAAALPLIPVLGSLGSSSHSDLQVFANAFVSTTTGGLFNTCDSVTGILGLNLGLGATLSTTFSAKFNKWAVQQCYTHYHDNTLCGEVSAYLAATVYAAQRGWTAVEFFAALGVDRVNHWHDTLGNICASPSCPAHTCDPIWGKWDAWYQGFATISADAYISEALELKTKGFLAVIDTAIAATVKANVDVDVHAGAVAVVHRDLPVVGGIVAAAKADAALKSVTKLDLLHHDVLGKTVVDATGHVLGGAVIGRGIDASAASHIDAEVEAIAKLNALKHGKVIVDAAGHIDGNAAAHVGRSIDAFAAGNGVAKVGHVVGASGEGFALVDKEGVIAAGQGGLKAAGVAVAGQGHAVVY